MKLIRNLTLFIATATISLNIAASKGHLSLFDSEIYQMISHKAGVNLKYGMYGSNVSWSGLLNDIKSGDSQITGSATITNSRKSWANFTIPYRTEEVVLYLPADKYANINSVQDFINYATSRPMKIGVIKDWVQPTKELNDFVTDKKNSNIFITGASDAEVTKMLVSKKIDAAILERACMHDSPISNNKKYKAHRMQAVTPISFILTKNGKNAVSDKDVEKLNTAIAILTADGTLQNKFEYFLKDE